MIYSIRSATAGYRLLVPRKIHPHLAANQRNSSTSWTNQEEFYKHAASQYIKRTNKLLAGQRPMYNWLQYLAKVFNFKNIGFPTSTPLKGWKLSISKEAKRHFSLWRPDIVDMHKLQQTYTKLACSKLSSTSHHANSILLNCNKLNSPKIWYLVGKYKREHWPIYPISGCKTDHRT